MTSQRALLISIRFLVVIFSLQFIRDAFYKWDGFSYYMTFFDFLPDLSLTFIIWIALGASIAFLFWSLSFLFCAVLPASARYIRFEHFIFCLIFICIFLLLNALGIPFSRLIGVGKLKIILLVTFILIVFIVASKRYINYEKLVIWVDESLRPLFWLFVVFFIISVPLSGLDIASEDSNQNTEIGAKILGNAARPNIILVTMDALSVYDMQAYGYSRPTTPFITEWAKEATLFRNAYSASNWTSSSVMSLLTGQKLWTHGVWHFVMNRRNVKPYPYNMPALLKRAGYATYAFVQNIHSHPQKIGLADAFLKKDDHSTYRLPQGWFATLASYLHSRPIVQEWLFIYNPLAEVITQFSSDKDIMGKAPAEIVYNHFLEYISKNEKKPFFAWLHLDAPHAPYVPPKPFLGTFDKSTRLDTINKQISWKQSHKQEFLARNNADVLTMRSRYDEMILYADKRFEIFMNRLKKRLNLSNTIIILSADHGEDFSHGFIGHSVEQLYEPLIHIPLIIKLPGQTLSRVVDTPVEQIDLAPTILDLVNLQIPTWMEGRSLVPSLMGNELEVIPVYSMLFRKNRSFGNPITKGVIAVRDGDFKLIYYIEKRKALLFDVSQDPYEDYNLYDTKTVYSKRLLNWITGELDRVNTEVVTMHRKKD